MVQSMVALTRRIFIILPRVLSAYRRLGVVYAEVEEIQEMMPIHPNFQRKAVKVHMHLQVQVPQGAVAHVAAQDHAAARTWHGGTAHAQRSGLSSE